jgi:LuxR family maltose regulon positive regulatory protein
VLTPRELEVLALLSKALSVKGVARVLGLSPGTVKWHVKNIYAKLGAVSREETLAKARGLRLIR